MVFTQICQVDAEIAYLAGKIADDILCCIDIVENRPFDQSRTHIVGGVGLIGEIDGIVRFVRGTGNVELDDADLLIKTGKFDRGVLIGSDVAVAGEGHAADGIRLLDIERCLLVAALPEMVAVKIEADRLKDQHESDRLRHEADESGKALLLDTG